jgi:hypothetical protein
MLSRAISPSFGTYSAVLRHSGLLMSRVVSIERIAKPIQNLVVSESFHHGPVMAAHARRLQRVVGELNSWARLLILRSVPLDASARAGRMRSSEAILTNSAPGLFSILKSVGLEFRTVHRDGPGHLIDQPTQRIRLDSRNCHVRQAFVKRDLALKLFEDGRFGYIGFV